MTMKREFVNVDTETFSATVPSLGMLSAMTVMKIAVEKDAVRQFEMSVEEFRKSLTADKLVEFDALTFQEWSEIVLRWMEASNGEDTHQLEEGKKKWWKFW